MARRGRQDTRKQKREARRAAREHAQAEAERGAARRRWTLLGLAVGTLGGSAVLWQLDADRVWIGMLLLVGIGLWLAVALGALGMSTKPRDRSKAGNIDYGSRP